MPAPLDMEIPCSRPWPPLSSARDRRQLINPSAPNCEKKANTMMSCMLPVPQEMNMIVLENMVSRYPLNLQVSRGSGWYFGRAEISSEIILHNPSGVLYPIIHISLAFTSHTYRYLWCIPFLSFARSCKPTHEEIKDCAFVVPAS